MVKREREREKRDPREKDFTKDPVTIHRSTTKMQIYVSVVLTFFSMLVSKVSGCTITDSNFQGYVGNWLNGETNPGGCSEISLWDVSRVTRMDEVFSGQIGFDVTGFNADISKWNVSSVTSMYGMFLEATAFNADIGVINNSVYTLTYQ